MSRPQCWTQWSNSLSPHWYPSSLWRQMWDFWVICKPRKCRARPHYFRVSRVIDG